MGGSFNPHVAGIAVPPVSVVNTHGRVGQKSTFLIGPRHALQEDTKCVYLNPCCFSILALKQVRKELGFRMNGPGECSFTFMPR